ncbi:P-loop containing nucleoside triphosphate hydrolase protein [Baffinella frigidus]|nr:P-loop containing nucleoside triphosphate hydrolase protein [Cryptophyta sp. CCMP2293]
MSGDQTGQALLLRSKVIVVGDAGVGKSAIVQMFHSKGTHYPKQYVMTTGCNFVMKELKVPNSNTTVELHIYDSSGQDVFRDLTCEYWKNANMVMLVYDVTNEQSFQNLGTWLDLVRKRCPEKMLPGVVVANKIEAPNPKP